MTVEGKTAVITGAASGIGAAVARLFAAQGAQIIIGDISSDAESVAQEITDGGGSAAYLRTDVTDEKSVAELMGMAVEKFGKLDILVANAGVPENKAPIHELDLVAWQRVIDIDLTGVALSNKHAATMMLRNGGGAIINMASILGHVGQENSTAYSAAKAAVVNLTRSIALTYAQDNLRVNCVSPGYVNTPLIAELPEETRTRIVERMPIGRLLEPEEVARVVLFLASDQASGITGAAVNVDGGYTAI